MATVPLICLVSCLAAHSLAQETYRIDETLGLGRQFDGIGGISGGGATSKLFPSYSDSLKSEILDYLFLPGFGASLQILKVEIGGDVQSTEGTESSHMHVSWEENYRRGYQWQMMVEAKKRNPLIKLAALPWSFPGWVGNGTENGLIIPERTAQYVVKWVIGAKKYYNLTIDYLGIWNEHPYSKEYIKVLRKRLDECGFTSTYIVAGEGGGWGVAHDIVSDAALSQAVGVISTHYPVTQGDSVGLGTGKPMWASEDYSTLSDSVGAGCMARTINQNYVNGHMTSTIMWHMISSFYPALPFSSNGFLTADQPWSGYYLVLPTTWITAHTTQFTAHGWTYLEHGSGVGFLQGGGSHVSFTSPDRSQLTVVVETMSYDSSKCLYGHPKRFEVVEQSVTFELSGTFANIKSFHVWVSHINKTAGMDISNLMIYKGVLTVTGHLITLPSILPDTLITLTTVAGGSKGRLPPPPPPSSFPASYSEYYSKMAAWSPSPYLSPQTGSFEVQPVEGLGKVLVQTALQPPVHWCAPSIPSKSPFAFIGTARSNSTLIATMRVPAKNGTQGMMLALRANNGSCHMVSSRGLYFWLFPSTHSFVVSNDYAMESIVTAGRATVQYDTWHTLSLEASGSVIIGHVDSDVVFRLNNSPDMSNGSAGVGAYDFGLVFVSELHLVST